MPPDVEDKASASSPAPEEVFAINDELVLAVREAIDSGGLDHVQEIAATLHSADVADLIQLVGPDRRARLVEALRLHLDPDILTELDDRVRSDVIEQLGPEETATAIADLETDEAVQVLEQLDDATQSSVLTAIPAAERQPIEESLAYPEDSAARLMQRDLVAVPDFWSIGRTIDFMRGSDDLPEEFYEIFVVDPAYHPIGTLPLNRAMRTHRPVVVGDIMDSDPHVIPLAMDQEKIAHVFERYNVPSAAVVDEDGRLVGVIMVDDVLDIILEEAEEDIMRLGGVGETNLYDSVLATTRRRFPWLLVNLGTAVVASLVIAIFEASIEQIVALAVLMPIVASMGGNAGTQTLTVTVRALATRDLTRANMRRVLVKEIAVSVLNGALFALITGAVAWLWFASPGLGLVIMAAMIINIVVAGLSGMLIPLGLNRIGVDPALAATVFVTTITDVIGFFSFLGLAAWLLL